jgi:hypothetical protein
VKNNNKKNKNKKVNTSAAQQRLSTNVRLTEVSFPQNLTAAICDSLRRDLLTACMDVVEKRGLIIEGGALTNIDLRHGFNIGFRVGIPMADGSIYSTEKAMFEILSEGYGLRPSDYGRILKIDGEAFRITGINPSRPKYPISVKRLADERSYKFSAENIRIYIKATK